MEQENLIEKLSNHIFEGECRLCLMMKWNKKCPWKIMSNMTVKEMDEYEEKHPNFFEDSKVTCQKILTKKLSKNIKFEGQKIKCTDEGAKFLTSFFDNLKSFETK